MRRLTVGNFFALLLCLLVTSTTAAQPTEQEPDFPVYIPIIFHDYTPTWVWEAPISLPIYPSPNKIVMGFDGSQNLHLLWDKSAFASGGAFIYDSILKGQDWTTPAPISQTLGESLLLNPPVLGPDGRLHLLWRATSFGGPYRLVYSSLSGATWGPEVEFLSETKDAYPVGIVRVNAVGEPNLLGSYSNVFDTPIRHWILHRDGIENDPIPNLSGVQQIWPDANNGLRIYSDEWPSGQGRYDYWKNGLKVTTAYFGTRINYRTGILDRENNLHLFRIGSVPIPGSTVTGLYHQCLDKNLGWGKEEVITGTVGLSGYGPNAYLVTSSQQGNIAAAFLDGKTGNVGVITWQECTLTTQATLPGDSPYIYLYALNFSELPNRVCILRRASASAETFDLHCATLR